MAAYPLKLLSRRYKDVCMHPQNYMNTEVLVENQLMPNKDGSLGDADIQRLVLSFVEPDEIHM